MKKSDQAAIHNKNAVGRSFLSSLQLVKLVLPWKSTYHNGKAIRSEHSGSCSSFDMNEFYFKVGIKALRRVPNFQVNYKSHNLTDYNLTIKPGQVLVMFTVKSLLLIKLTKNRYVKKLLLCHFRRCKNPKLRR